MVAAATIVVIIIVWSAFSAPLDRRGITSALFFTVAGFVVGASALGWLDISVESAVAERVTEIALVLLLFSDAARLDLRSLRRELGWPSRLLLIGLPLTMIAGVGVGWLVFPGMALASVVLLSTMLASTDAALGQKVVTDTSVPARVRQALDVESGLNDGLAVPFFLVALDVANAELETGVTSAVVSNAAAQIGWGLAGGRRRGLVGGCCSASPTAATGSAVNGGRSCPWRWRSSPTPWRVTLGGSGFIAAFVGGMAFGRASGARGSVVTLFTEEAGGFSPPSPGSGSERWRSRWRSRTSPGRSSSTPLSA